MNSTANTSILSFVAKSAEDMTRFWARDDLCPWAPRWMSAPGAVAQTDIQIGCGGRFQIYTGGDGMAARPGPAFHTTVIFSLSLSVTALPGLCLSDGARGLLRVRSAGLSSASICLPRFLPLRFARSPSPPPWRAFSSGSLRSCSGRTGS